MDGSGNVYFVDYNNNMVRKVDAGGIISIYAGTGDSGSDGDGGAAIASQLNGPTAVSVDVNGNAYIADKYNTKIRMVNSAGIITTIAGTGEYGGSGDGGPATLAQLSYPDGVAVDVKGILYIIDMSKIRMVSITGIITTFAGTGASGISSGDGGLAIAATFGYITAISADIFGKLYIADANNNNIRMVATSGIITTFAGMGLFGGDGGAATLALINQPNAVSVDLFGNVYIVDSGNNRIRKVSNSGIITTFAGTGDYGSNGDGGVAISAQFKYPCGISADGNGNVYIADANNNKIRMVNAAGIITTYAGTGFAGSDGDDGPASLAQFNALSGVSADGNGNVYIADANNNKIRKVDSDGIITTFAGTGSTGSDGDDGPASLALLNYPYGVSADGIGNVYIADTYNNKIRMVNSDGIITTIAGNGDFGSDGDSGPGSLAADGNGNVYIADYFNNKIRMVNSAGIITTIAGTGEYGSSGDGAAAALARLTPAAGLAADNNGNIYIAEVFNNKIRVVSSDGKISTYAGKGLSGGDGGPASLALLNNPAGVTADGLGNVYIADTNNNKIRMVNSAGIVTTIAGTGDHGSSGDGGAATVALLGHPYGVSADNNHKLFIMDTDNNKIRVMVLPVSLPIPSPTPVPIAAPTTIPPKTSPGNLINFAGTGVSGNSGDGGPATSAQISLNAYQPMSMDVNGNVYFVDMNNNKVRKVSAAGIISTYAGTGTSGSTGDNGPASSAQLTHPSGISVDVNGNAYIADYGNSKIRKVSSLAIITTYAGTGNYGSSGDGGAATLAQLYSPLGVSVDISGILYIIDNYSSLIRMVSITGIITTFAGTGASGISSGDGGLAIAATFGYITAISADIFGKLYIADPNNNIIRMVSSSGIITTFAGMILYGGDGDAATLALINQPSDVSVDLFGNIYIVDSDNNRIRKVNSAGIITTFAGTGSTGSDGDDGPATSAQLNLPFGVSADGNGNVYIADYFNNKIRMVNAAGIITTYAGTGDFGSDGDDGPASLAQLYSPYGVSADGNGNVYIADSLNNKIRMVNSDGIITTYAGTGSTGSDGDDGPATSAQLNSPLGISADQNGNVFIADAGNVRIRMVNSDGIISTLAGTGTQGSSGDGGVAISAQLVNPNGVSADQNGNVYIADTGNGKIRVVSSDGIITTYAGKGLSGGDGGPATLALLNIPVGVTADVSGNVYIADTNNNKIRMVNSAGIITTIAGTGEYGSSGDGGAASLALLGHPCGVSADNNQNVYIVDTENNKIRVMVLPVPSLPTSQPSRYE